LVRHISSFFLRPSRWCIRPGSLCCATPIAPIAGTGPCRLSKVYVIVLSACCRLQGDAAIKAWESSFASIYGPLLGLEAEKLFDSDSETVLQMMKDQGLLKPGSKRKHADLQRQQAVRRWTSATAVGGDTSVSYNEDVWPPRGASAQSPQLEHWKRGNGLSHPRQAKDPHTLLIGASQGLTGSRRVGDFPMHPAELDQDRMALLRGQC
jgi:hypothetical protein